MNLALSDEYTPHRHDDDYETEISLTISTSGSRDRSDIKRFLAMIILAALPSQGIEESLDYLKGALEFYGAHSYAADEPYLLEGENADLRDGTITERLTRRNLDLAE